MQFQQDIQTGSKFIFPEVQDFEPEYSQDIVTCYVDTSVAASFAKQNWLKKMLAMPKMMNFALDNLSKVSNFANDLQGSVKKVESRISVLEDSHGDFRLMNERLYKVEMNSAHISELTIQMDHLSQKNRMLTMAVLGLGVVNLAFVGFLLFK